jgi:hypothetical protein
VHERAERLRSGNDSAANAPELVSVAILTRTAPKGLRHRGSRLAKADSQARAPLRRCATRRWRIAPRGSVEIHGIHCSPQDVGEGQSLLEHGSPVSPKGAQAMRSSLPTSRPRAQRDSSASTSEPRGSTARSSTQTTRTAGRSPSTTCDTASLLGSRFAARPSSPFSRARTRHRRHDPALHRRGRSGGTRRYRAPVRSPPERAPRRPGKATQESYPKARKYAKLCGAEGDRTPDLMHAMHALSQLSYSPEV